ncbi:MAG: amidohydrolase family protein [Burkholderiales bacterium]
MRRKLLGAASLAALASPGCGALSFWPDEGVRNRCHATLPAHLATHPAVLAAWEGIDPADLWDAHTHLVGTGDSGSGVYVNPSMTRPANPLLYARFLFYLNAGCVHDAPGKVDETYVARLLNLVEGMRPGFKAMLFAFDATVDADGEPQLAQTIFHVPNEYAATVARRHPTHFEWVASIHPYRADAVDRLTKAVQSGARAVKWLPNAMLIDPGAPRCDPFYDALVRFDLPLITHAGFEAAVHSPDGQSLGNPLRLRRALDLGVRVIVAHCASLGEDVDLDAGPNGPRLSSFSLFSRLMAEERYHGRLFGDISAMILRNRVGEALAHVLERSEWHPRLVNGSDYPLPGILPIVSVDGLVRAGFLAAALGPVLRELREYNPLLFDFVLKRHLRSKGHRFDARVFATRSMFAPRPVVG